MRKRMVLVATVLVLACLFGVVVWPTPYRYETVQLRISSYSRTEPTYIRTNRLTGAIERLTPRGWFPVN